MARPTLFTHPKFARLVALVGGRAVALGSLELIWSAAYASGDAVIGDPATVEAVADWKGEGGALAAALLLSGFMDEAGAELAVHDLDDHAPDYVRKRRQREAERREKAVSVRQRLAVTAERPTVATVDLSLTGQCPPLSAKVQPPSPSPSPKDPGSGARVRSPEPKRMSVVVVAADGSEQRVDPDQVPAEPMPPDRWPAHRWFELFSAAWCAKYSRIAYGGGMADAKATGALADTIAALPAAEARAAEARAAEMFAEFLRDEAPKVKAARHPWSFFVTAWNGLRVAAAAGGAGAKIDPRCEWHRKPGSRGKRARHPDKNCPECKHAEAMGRGRVEEEPKSASDLLAEKAASGAFAEAAAKLRAEREAERNRGGNGP